MQDFYLRGTLKLTSMLYAFLGSSLLGALTAAWLLWRKGRVETALADATNALGIANINIQGWKESYALLQDQLSRSQEDTQTVKAQRDAYLKELTDAGTPGVFADLLRKRNTGHQDAG